MIALKGCRSVDTGRGGLNERVKTWGEQHHIYAVQALYRMLQYRPDRADQWSDIDITLNNGGGDCEDFAIAGYRLLRALGWPPGRLAIVSGTDIDGQGHAMLAYFFERKWHYLDNRTGLYYVADECHWFKPFAAVDEVSEVALLSVETSTNCETKEKE